MAITMNVYGRLSATLTIHMKRARENAVETAGQRYARSIAPTPAWRENGWIVRKAVVSSTACFFGL
jgi:hypothetical protein